ncbi:unnamed protein product [Amoebophrya sp. A120]|nr:unnamed protein product [Amoebophrya sp. A120]|eukprot:GSA120T00009841001.1
MPAGILKAAMKEQKPKSSFPHLVFVYGTLKKDFFNYNRFMKAKENLHWTLVSSHAVLESARIRAFFVDCYYTPYLVLAPEQDKNKVQPPVDAEILSGGDLLCSEKPGLAQAELALGEKLQQSKTAHGELYRVDDVMLAELDELEGIARDRYTRSVVRVEAQTCDVSEEAKAMQQEINPVSATPGRGPGRAGEQETAYYFDAFVYHLRAEKVPTEILEGASSMPSSIRFIENYALEKHRQNYVVKEERDMSRYQPDWGGYV